MSDTPDDQTSDERIEAEFQQQKANDAPTDGGGGDTLAAPDDDSIGGGDMPAAAPADDSVGGGDTPAAAPADDSVGGGDTPAAPADDSIGGGDTPAAAPADDSIGGGDTPAAAPADDSVGGSTSGGNSTLAGQRGPEHRESHDIDPAATKASEEELVQKIENKSSTGVNNKPAVVDSEETRDQADARLADSKQREQQKDERQR